jgi:hypothetical protein
MPPKRVLKSQQESTSKTAEKARNLPEDLKAHKRKQMAPLLISPEVLKQVVHETGVSNKSNVNHELCQRYL